MKNIGKQKTITLRALLIILTLYCLVNTAAAASSTTDSTTTAPTNMVVDFDSTSFESTLRAGDSGILNLVIKNTGSRRAENVQVLLPSTGAVNIDKSFYIGEMEAGASKTLPVVIRVDSNAKTGLSAVQVQISYDGYDSAGSYKDNQLTTWEVPLRIYGNPLFQITPSKTSYYKDSLEDLELDGITMDSVKSLEATLSSSCVTVIGSSRKYIGSINSSQRFNLIYPIKPTSAGACAVSLYLSYTDESGNRASDNISLGLNVEEAGVDFKVANISYDPTGPGETAAVRITLKNVGNADAKDTTLSLSLDDPFTPVDSQEKYVGEIKGGAAIEVEFRIAIGWDAETKTYSIPLNVTYKVGGTSHTAIKNIGIDVSGKTILEIMSLESRSGSVRVDVANIGTRTADGVKATLIIPGSGGLGLSAGGRSGNQSRGGFINRTTGGDQYIVSYKSDIKPTKQTTFTFSTQATGPATLVLEYSGPNNERINQTERITLTASGVISTSTGSTASARNRTSTTSSTTSYIYYALGLLILWTAYRRYKHEKIVPDYVAKKIGELRKRK